MESSVRAVYDDELEEFLDKLGMLQKIHRGEVLCRFCGTVVTLENLLAVFPDSGQIFACCDKTGCQAALSEAKVG